MVHCVTRSSVDDWRVGNVFAIVNHNRPDIDEDEECNVSKLLQW